MAASTIIARTYSLNSLISAMEHLSLESNTSLQLAMTERYEGLQAISENPIQANFLAVDTKVHARVMISVIKTRCDPHLLQIIARRLLSSHDNVSIFMLRFAQRMVVVTPFPYDSLPKQLGDSSTSTSFSYRRTLQTCSLAERSFATVLQKRPSYIMPDEETSMSRWYRSPATCRWYRSPATFSAEASLAPSVQYPR